MLQRRPSKKITVGGVTIGGGHPIIVQTMCTTQTANIKATIEQIHQLEEIGCELIRVAVIDEASAQAISTIKKNIHIPLVADVLYDVDIIIKAIRRGADKIRINPGKLDPDQLQRIVEEARIFRIPIRVGINSGSLPEDIVTKYGITAHALVLAAEQAVDMFKLLQFENIIVSIKSTDVLQTIDANREFAKRHSYPIHLGITQAGTSISGVVRTSTALGALLSDGIGDTVRFSLSGDSKTEILAAHALLRSLQLRQGPVVYAGSSSRSQVDVHSIAKHIEEEVAPYKVAMKIGIIGSTVEEDELKTMDLGIAGEGDHAIFYKDGVRVGKIDRKDITARILKEVKKRAQ